MKSSVRTLATWTVAFLVAALACASPASAALVDLEGGDGDQECLTERSDWACLGDTVATAVDGAGAGDGTFKGKELEPRNWTVESGLGADKTDLQTVWSHDRESEDAYELFLGFARAKGEGAVHLSFELNQVRSSWINGAGTAVPCRTDGDVLISYVNGGIELYTWSGDGGSAACPDGGSGTWGGKVVPGAAAEGKLNAVDIDNFLPGAPARLATATFGEAALDIGALAGQIGSDRPCEFFRGLQAHSRSAPSITSDMGDFVAPIPVTVAACIPDPPGGETPDTPSIAASAGCHADGTVTLSGAAEPGHHVEVVESGAGTVATAQAGADGAWTATVNDVAQGVHAYRARARDDAGNASGFSPIAQIAVDRVAPLAPTVVAPAEIVAGALTLSGAAQPGATVTVREGDAVAGTAVAAADGAWTLTIAAVAAGAHAFDVAVSDACATGPAVRAIVTATGLGTGPVGGPVGGPGPGLPAANPPRQVVAGVQVSGCAAKPFRVLLPGKGLKEVAFSVDRRTIALVRRRDHRGRFVTVIDPRRFAEGTHRIRAKVITTKGRRKTFKLRTFTACAVGQCVSRRAFRIRVRLVKGDRVRSASVFVNGKRVRVVRGKRLRAKVVLAGLPKGKFRVKVVSRLASGRTDVDERTYRTCAKKRKMRKP